MKGYKHYNLSNSLILFTVYLLQWQCLLFFSGELIKVLTDPEVRKKTALPDLCLYDTTLVVLRCQDSSVIFYEMLTE